MENQEYNPVIALSNGHKVEFCAADKFPTRAYLQIKRDLQSMVLKARGKDVDIEKSIKLDVEYFDKLIVKITDSEGKDLAPTENWLYDLALADFKVVESRCEELIKKANLF